MLSEQNDEAEKTVQEGDEQSDLVRLEEPVPRLAKPRPGFVRRWMARIVLAIGGWKLGTPPPDLPKYVIVAAPHTFWWDGFWMLAFSWRWGLRVSWLVKESSTRGLMGWLPRLLGGIPVDRSSPQGLVDRLADQFDDREELLLLIPPEGTRSKREYWRSGFYHIAKQANVPICLSYLDYSRKEAGIGLCMYLSDDLVRDMDRVREFYRDIRGRIPENFTFPRLVEEEKRGNQQMAATSRSIEDRPLDTSDE